MKEQKADKRYKIRYISYSIGSIEQSPSPSSFRALHKEQQYAWPATWAPTSPRNKKIKNKINKKGQRGMARAKEGKGPVHVYREREKLSKTDRASCLLAYHSSSSSYSCYYYYYFSPRRLRPLMSLDSFSLHQISTCCFPSSYQLRPIPKKDEV